MDKTVLSQMAYEEPIKPEDVTHFDATEITTSEVDTSSTVIEDISATVSSVEVVEDDNGITPAVDLTLQPLPPVENTQLLNDTAALFVQNIISTAVQIISEPAATVNNPPAVIEPISPSPNDPVTPTTPVEDNPTVVEPPR